MKKILLFAFIFAAIAPVAAQNTKKIQRLPAKQQHSQEAKLNAPPPAVPPAENPFGLPLQQRRPLPAFVPFSAAAPQLRVTRGENGLPILFEGLTEASGHVQDVKTGALSYVESLHPAGIAEPLTEFAVKNVETDELGNAHVRLEQLYKGVPVFGGEVIAHARRGAFDLLNGRYFPTPQLASVVPLLNADRAIDKVKEHIGAENIKTGWTAEQSKLFNFEAFKAELVIYHHDFQLNNERLAWHIEIRPNMLSRVVYFVDANSGEIIHHYDNTCNLTGFPHSEPVSPGKNRGVPQPASSVPPFLSAPPPVDGNGQDLFNVNQTFKVWKEGSVYYMEDATKSMFKPAPVSTMPSDPVGVIVTLDAIGTSPENQNFDYKLVSTNSGTATFNNKAAVSAHINSIKSYDYFQNTHGRKSIDGEGGNIHAFVNVVEGNGAPMDNAYWNGDAMWYGNGDQIFLPLARGLDVGGHEMTHGVIERTANLLYQDESGALNESFADVFGAMIDRDDWQIGETVMKPGISSSGALRDLMNPANGDVAGGGNNFGGNFWQPGHVNQKYTGNNDNGGVHKNSGIPNRAFYLFASNVAVGKDKAEKVYYKALKDYLVKSSKFVDCRIAVIQAAKDLYGNAVADIAANAFTSVGIGGNEPGGNYLGQLSPNPGDDYILCVTNDKQKLELAAGNGQVLGPIYDKGLFTRPSITDDGREIVFVNTTGDVVKIDLQYTPTEIIPTENIISSGLWRNVAISKDGRFIAGLYDQLNDTIYILDRQNQNARNFKLYNPTYSQQPTATGEVQFADVLEFDYSGQYIMYDAFNRLSNTSGDDISYWDIGFLQFWENGGFANPYNAFISKLFNGLPEKSGVGNPAFAKNSPYIVAFDFIDGINNQNDIYGVNVETGDYNVILANNGDLGWPNYNRLDNALIYQGPNSSNITNIYTHGLAADKISPSGNETQFIANHRWGVWYADGFRSLQVSAGEPEAPAFRISVAPNPATDMARLTIRAKTTADARISLFNSVGGIVQVFDNQLSVGENQVDLNLRNLPAGAYVVRLLAGSASAAVKLIKQ